MKAPGNLAVDAARRAERVLHDLGSHRTGIVVGEGFFAGEHLVQNDAEGKYIGPDIELLAEDLLRRHICRRADERARQGKGFKVPGVGNAEVTGRTRAMPGRR